MEYKGPLSYQDWTPERRAAGFGDGSVTGAQNRLAERTARVEASTPRETRLGEVAPHVGALAHRGMVDVVLADREARPIIEEDGTVRPRTLSDPAPRLTTTEIIQAVGKRIDRPPIDGESVNITKPGESSSQSSILKQDMGWRGYRARTVKPNKDVEIPNHMRPTNFRQRWAARRMEYAYHRYTTYANKSLYMKRRYGIKNGGELLDRTVQEALPYPERSREFRSGIQERTPDVRRGIFEKIKDFKIDMRISYIDWRASQKKKKFDRIASGKWWAI